MITYDPKLHAANIVMINARSDAADKKNETDYPATLKQSWMEYVKAKVKATAGTRSPKLPYAVVMEAA